MCVIVVNILMLILKFINKILKISSGVHLGVVYSFGPPNFYVTVEI